MSPCARRVRTGPPTINSGFKNIALSAPTPSVPLRATLAIKARQRFTHADAGAAGQAGRQAIGARSEFAGASLRCLHAFAARTTGRPGLPAQPPAGGPGPTLLWPGLLLFLFLGASYSPFPGNCPLPFPAARCSSRRAALRSSPIRDPPREHLPFPPLPLQRGGKRLPLRSKGQVLQRRIHGHCCAVTRAVPGREPPRLALRLPGAEAVAVTRGLPISARAPPPSPGASPRGAGRQEGAPALAAGSRPRPPAERVQPGGGGEPLVTVARPGQARAPRSRSAPGCFAAGGRIPEAGVRFSRSYCPGLRVSLPRVAVALTPAQGSRFGPLQALVSSSSAPGAPLPNSSPAPGISGRTRFWGWQGAVVPVETPTGVGVLPAPSGPTFPARCCGLAGRLGGTEAEPGSGGASIKADGGWGWLLPCQAWSDQIENQSADFLPGLCSNQWPVRCCFIPDES